MNDADVAMPSPSQPGRRTLLVRSLGLAVGGLIGATASRPALAQAATFPSRPLTLVVPFGPGGIADLTARVVAEAMGRSLGQPVVVDNRPGAGSIVASQAVAHAAPDGHTLLLMSNGHAVSASLFRKLPYDVQKDFAPVAPLGRFGLVACVGAGSRFRSLAELVAWARAQPGKLTIASIAVGSTQHLAAELFLQRAGLQAVLVPYKGSPAVVNALRAGEVDLAFEILGPILGQLKDPKGPNAPLRALAVTDDQREPALPEAPTLQESGLAGLRDLDITSWNALAAPAATPPELIQRLNRAAREALAQPAVAQRLRELGVRPEPGSPADLARLLASEIPRWRGVIDAAKIERQ